MSKPFRKVHRVFSRISRSEPESPLKESISDSSPGCNAKYGLFVFVDKPSEQVDGIDIVAVHGLNGHYIKTWSTELPDSGQHYNWLQAALTQAIPTARIMSFGYDSAVFSKSVADIGDFADQLLQGLLAKRCNPGEQTRPLLFLCHSLGGIVFKKALVRAHERNHYTKLLDYVQGVAFFGTPHQGSEAANWAKILASILNAVSFNSNMNSILLESLQAQSEVLFEISESFVDRCEGLKIVSFYETHKLPGTSIVVVPKNSALLLRSNEVPVPLNGDHRSLCRFSITGEDRERLELVLNSLKNITKEIHPQNRKTELSPEDKTAIQELYPGNYESFKDLNATRTLGTCERLLEHPRYQEWRHEDQSSLLWISGNPGCGKSTLARFLADYLKSLELRTPARETVCHFFFKEGISNQQSAVLALRAILHQIFSCDEVSAKYFLSEYKLKGSKVLNEFDTLFVVLEKVVMDPGSKRVVCILDALDECPQSDVAKLLEALRRSYQAQEKAQVMPRLKVVIFSRPENLIKNVLKRYEHSIRLRGEDEIATINHDISLVIQQCVKDLQAEVEIPYEMSKDLSQNLESGANNTFLWVTLMVKVLREHIQSYGGISKNDLQSLLHGYDIFAVYNHMLRKIIPRPDANKMLQIVIAARKALTIEQMSVALAVKQSHTTLEDISSEIKYPQEDYIKVLCGHFVCFVGQEIHLVHQTAREFLLEQANEESVPRHIWQHTMTLAESHRTLLEVCILYLICGERSGWNVPSYRTFEDMKREISYQQPLLDYAAINWCFHFNRSKVTIGMNVLKQFLKSSHLLHAATRKVAGY
ncbi:hypothetical protein F4813DRAFT_401203 [Daldinia decipiens]|uniref:uncharacterized protein n=1 Tax=Daldinia decipiens TaxID=326647 RepID=UPI0020C5580E|nr:uncharacterized protein F4813DRAFT_401203 [Daldinia decipiens]KAI1660262.1 hypothetical protein F4813DRAFT_401203 [Daldinia decipiens]